MCGNQVEEFRAVELGSKICGACAQARGTERHKGIMIFDHKTAPYVQIMDAESYKENKKYYYPNGARSAVKNFSKHICS